MTWKSQVLSALRFNLFDVAIAITRILDLCITFENLRIRLNFLRTEYRV